MTRDGAEWPYVKDFEDRWHKRSPDDQWQVDGPIQARTLCGMGIGSVHVSQYDPRLEAMPREVFCECLDTQLIDGDERG